MNDLDPVAVKAALQHARRGNTLGMDDHICINAAICTYRKAECLPMDTAPLILWGGSYDGHRQH